jgi:sugar/nucleoside kinase (ribokinase family)
LVRGCKVLLLDSFALKTGVHAAQLAHADHIPVVADVEPPYIPEMDRFIDQVDHLIIGATLGAALSGKGHPSEMVQALASAQRACTVITAGDQGCWYAEGNGKVHYYPAFKIEVVDTTGCGDVFHGAYATALALGEGVSQAIAIATASAGLKAARPGGRTGIPDMGTVKEFLAQHAEHRERIWKSTRA